MTSQSFLVFNSAFGRQELINFYDLIFEINDDGEVIDINQCSSLPKAELNTIVKVPFNNMESKLRGFINFVGHISVEVDCICMIQPCGRRFPKG